MGWGVKGGHVSIKIQIQKSFAKSHPPPPLFLSEAGGMVRLFIQEAKSRCTLEVS